MIPADALKLLQETAVKAAGQAARIVQVPGEAPHVYYLVQPDGTLEKHEATARRTAALSNTPAAVVVWLETMSPELVREVWYDTAGVVGLAGGIERTTFHLNPSDPFNELVAVAQLADGKTYTHADFIRQLNTTFRDALPSHGDLRTLVRKVDIKKAQEATGEISRKGVSMARSMVAEAAGADQLPEVLTFTVPRFSSPAVPVKVRVRAAFELDAQAERFRLTILPGEIETADAEGEAAVYKLITAAMGEGEKFAVHHGRPEE